MIVDHRAPILNAHNRVFSDPTGSAATRNVRLKQLGVTVELIEDVHKQIAAGNATSARAIARKLGAARLKVEAAIESLLATGRVHTLQGVLHV